MNTCLYLCICTHRRIRDYSSPKLVTSLKSKISNPKTPNPNRKLIIHNSKDEFVWDEPSCSPQRHNSDRQNLLSFIHQFIIGHCYVMMRLDESEIYYRVSGWSQRRFMGGCKWGPNKAVTTTACLQQQ